MEVIHKECYGRGKERAWYYTNGGCLEWGGQMNDKT